MNCEQNEDLILLDAAGELDADEAAQLHRHLDTGCPTCWGYRAAAEATLARLWLGLDHPSPPPQARTNLMKRIGTAGTLGIAPRRERARDWERIVLPAAIAALLAVAVTLLAVHHFMPPRPTGAPEARDMELALLHHLLDERQAEVNSLRTQLRGMQFAQMTGPAQPDALGRVFIDGRSGKWYFFTTGMKPASHGKTYELWLISEDKKIPAGTFNVNDQGTATLLGTVPPLPAGAAVSLAVTDEPAGGTAAPTGKLQIVGQVQ